MNGYKITNLAKFIGASIPVLLTGCAATHTAKWQEQSKHSEEKTHEYKDLRAQMKPEDDLVSNSSGFYVDKTPIKIVKDKKDLPQLFYKNISYMANNVNFNELSADVFKKSGLQINFVNLDDDSKAKSENAQPNNSPFDGQNNLPPALQQQLNSQMAQIPLIEEDNTSPQETDKTISIDYNGDLKGMFDYIAVKKNLKWKWDQSSSKVFFFPLDTETFTVFAIAENINLSSTVTTNVSNKSSGSGGGGSGGGGDDSSSDSTNNQSITYDQKQSYWTEVQDTIKGMISGKGKIAFNSVQGKITVTDNDFNLAKVKEYITQLNNDAFKQVTIDINMINLKLNDNRNLGVSLNLLNGRLSLLTGQGASSAANQFTGISYKGSKNSGLLNILDQFGQTTVEANISVVTSNNIPAPIQVTKNRAYVSQTSIEQSTNTTGGNLQQVETDTISEGITAQLTPKVFGQNIMLNYSMNLSVIDDLQQAPGDSLVQLPLTSTKNFVQRLTLRNGEPKVLAAFERSDGTNSSKHPLAPSLWFLGGNEVLDKTKEIILIVATPYITTLSQE